MRTIARLGFVILAILAAGGGSAQQLTENFNSVVPSGWIVVDRSNPAGSTKWFRLVAFLGVKRQKDARERSP